MKIALVMGHTLTGKGSGAVSGIWNESKLTRRVGSALIQYLSDNKHKLKHEYDVIATDMSTDYIVAQANHLNAIGYDYALQIHFNCSAYPSSNGTEILEWEPSEIGSKLCEEISAGLDTRNRGTVQRKDLAFLRLTKMKSFLVETCFISSEVDMQKFSINEFIYIDYLIKALEKYL